MSLPAPITFSGQSLSASNLDEVRRTLKDLYSQCGDVSAQIEAITAETEALLPTIAALTPAAVPWNALPDDVLQNIFIISHDSQENPPRCVQFSRIQPPVQVAQVCSSWRAITLATPELWSSFRCAMSFNVDKYTRDAVLEFIHLWMSRAGEHRLSLTIDNKDPTEKPATSRSFWASRPDPSTEWHANPAKFNLLKHVIVPNARLWKRLEINTPYWYRHTTAFLKLEPDFAHVEDLTVSLGSHAVVTPVAESDGRVFPFMNAITNLRRLKVDDCGTMTIDAVQTNWSNLVHLEVCHAVLETLVPVLLQAPLLETLSTCVGEGRAPVTNYTPPERLSLRNLKSLVLNSSLDDAAITFPCDFPRLEHLQLVSNDITEVCPRILETTCALDRLTVAIGRRPRLLPGNLGFAPPPPDDWVPVILGHPSIQQVTRMHVHCREFQVPDAMVQDIANGILLPKLQHFASDSQIPLAQLLVLVNAKGFHPSEAGGSVFYPTVANEGMAGVGETTSAAFPFEYLKMRNCDSQYTREPQVRELLRQVNVGEKRLVIEEERQSGGMFVNTRLEEQHELAWDVDG